MKTLDEVIKTLEDCEVRGGFFDWKYGISDALHYLKEYRKLDSLDNIAFREDAERIIVCPECHSELILLSESNNPLTWDELKQMEGKPVWLETKTKGGRWAIFERISSVYGLGDVAFFSCDVGITCYEKNIGKTWQAYRKERS